MQLIAVTILEDKQSAEIHLQQPRQFAKLNILSFIGIVDAAKIAHGITTQTPV